ncbi:hypothetical protein H2198_006823 [Neophaeococcomyces mojaviensis]|uniref:Uncharacterized protein n=1 Tax=Neophaeococcomyces mojaviensis TaxID=3383035 RepID=A0ACC3A1P9_9EURO|nr:hypothetical protein H2198_006823 [Knufia sp. JES_112]
MAGNDATTSAPTTSPSSDLTSPDPSSSSDHHVEEPRRPRRPRPKHDFPETQAGKLWKAFGNPEGGPVNEIAGGTYNSAGGKPKGVTWRDALSFDSFNNPTSPAWYKQPCARDALLVGIASGGGVGGVGFILRGLKHLQRTSNYAVGAFALSSVGMFYWCQGRRQEEARGMAAAVAGMKMLHEKKAREEAAEKERLRAAEEARRKAEEEAKKNRSWWKVW